MREVAVVTRDGEVMMIGGGSSRLDRLLTGHMISASQSPASAFVSTVCGQESTQVNRSVAGDDGPENVVDDGDPPLDDLFTGAEEFERTSSLGRVHISALSASIASLHFKTALVTMHSVLSYLSPRVWQ